MNLRLLLSALEKALVRTELEHRAQSGSSGSACLSWRGTRSAALWPSVYVDRAGRHCYFDAAWNWALGGCDVLNSCGSLDRGL